MTKELEELKRLRNFNNCDIHDPRMEEGLAVIEKALEQKEKLTEIIRKKKSSAELDLSFKRSELRNLTKTSNKPLKVVEEAYFELVHQIDELKGQIDAYTDVLCTIHMADKENETLH